MAKPSDEFLLDYLGFNPTGDLGPLTIYTTSRGVVVFYDRSPPKTPASYKQKVQRDRWRQVARLWNSLPQQNRDDWKLAADNGKLLVNGFALFMFYHTRRDDHAIRTIERQTGTLLL